jgi:hypothetical protein
MRTHTASRTSRILLVVVAFAVALLAGCSSDGSKVATAPPTTTATAVTHSYVGRAAGSDAFVGVVVDGKRVLAYVCDGVPGSPTGTTPTIQAWFNGPSDGASVDVSQPAGRLQLQLTDSAMTGTLTLTGGRTLAVTGQTTTGDAGLYRAEAAATGGPAVAGWILAADGVQRGGVGGSLTISGTTLLNTSQLSFSFQSLATARISRVGITPIPIP